jgi:hypothetical protein
VNPAALPVAAVGGAARLIAVRFALAVVVVAFFLGIWLGYRWGSGVQSDRVSVLSDRVIAVSAERDAARNVATGNADAVLTLRDALKREADTKRAQQRAAIAELDARAGRIAQLERLAAQRQQALNKKVDSDEDCNVLRTTPVCAALARGLWGDQAAADPY